MEVDLSSREVTSGCFRDEVAEERGRWPTSRNVDEIDPKHTQRNVFPKSTK